MTASHQPQAAATDVAEFITDLDGGRFDTLLSIALSQVAAGVVDHDAKGSVTVKLDFAKVPGSHQVTCAHKLTFTRPTADGKASEEVTRKTSLHVGQMGRLTLVPENQMKIFERDGAPATK